MTETSSGNPFVGLKKTLSYLYYLHLYVYTYTRARVHIDNILRNSLLLDLLLFIANIVNHFSTYKRAFRKLYRSREIERKAVLNRSMKR
ncbi:hypothetical protein V1477_006807 [Vespula maculifrons]|uniref:Uncharacterized protein n=1 Tax=Vespula maculifrons TaxID=7453 RepID=A0ABD2CHH3_VESMC